MLYYNFNAFTGRLKPATQFQPMFPISPVPLQRTDPPVMVYDTIKTKPAVVNHSTQSGHSTVDPKLLEKYKFFQSDLSKPVYLMGGTKDKILFGITVALAAAGLSHIVYFVYTQAYPKK